MVISFEVNKSAELAQVPTKVLNTEQCLKFTSAQSLTALFYFGVLCYSGSSLSVVLLFHKKVVCGL